jgi:hypothetical protein
MTALKKHGLEFAKIMQIFESKMSDPVSDPDPDQEALAGKNDPTGSVSATMPAHSCNRH